MRLLVDLNISQHFRADEREFISQMDDLIATAVNQYRPVLTDFLNPRQIYIAHTLINRQERLKFRTWGGFPDAEMQKLLIYPDYYQPSSDDFQISCFQIDYPTKFAELHHRQVLGTLMGSGLERQAFGDIINQGDVWQIIVNTTIVPFMRQQIDRIGKIHVNMTEITPDELVQPQNDWEPIHTTVPSLRLDAVIANIFNYSRNRTKTIIEHGFVRVNWEEIDRPDYQLAVRDLISVRHGGRIQLLETGGHNRKNNLRLDLQIIKA